MILLVFFRWFRRNGILHVFESSKLSWLWQVSGRIWRKSSSNDDRDDSESFAAACRSRQPLSREVRKGGRKERRDGEVALGREGRWWYAASG